MLTGNLVRVRQAKNRIFPIYIDVTHPDFRETATTLLELYRSFAGRTRNEVEEEVRLALGDSTSQLVQQGLAKLCEDRCEFEVDAELAPETIREQAFLVAARLRKAGGYQRAEVISEVATTLKTTPELIDRGLFADLKSEQRVVSFEDCTVDQLLDRYNVALAQAILLRSAGVTIHLRGESVARYRQLFRAVKFHHLICEVAANGLNSYTLKLDGPLSLFSSTQKYGSQLANFLPTLLHCKNFQLSADVRWGADRKEKTFLLDHSEGLKSHTVDHGDYFPKELAMFGDSFQKNSAGWKIAPTTEIVELASGVWIPDFQLEHSATGCVVHLEVLGFWRKADVDKLYARLKREFSGAFILAVSEQMNIDEASDPASENNIYRFKKTPLPAEIIRLAESQRLQGSSARVSVKANPKRPGKSG